MAVTIAEATAETASTSNTTAYVTGAFNVTNGDLYIVMSFITGGGTLGCATSMTGARVTKLAEGSYNGGTDKFAIFSIMCVATETARNITASTSPGGTGAMVFVYRVTGHNNYDPIKQVATNTGSAVANPNATFAVAATSTNGCVGSFGINRQTPTSTPPTSWTEVADTGYTNPAAGGSAAHRASGETGTTITFTAASGAWACVICEINDAANGARPTDLICAGGMVGL